MFSGKIEIYQYVWFHGGNCGLYMFSVIFWLTYQWWHLFVYDHEKIYVLIICYVSDVIDKVNLMIFRKYNKGDIHPKQWVFGVTERLTNKVLFTVVQNRTKATLLPIILKHISKGATLHHDDWAAYRLLHQLGYKHLIVNHSKEFKSKDGACTNTIEGLWGVIKQRITRMHGVEQSKLSLYLDEFSFRYFHKHDMLSALLQALVCQEK